jgi:hypothetical protein
VLSPFVIVFQSFLLPVPYLLEVRVPSGQRIFVTVTDMLGKYIVDTKILFE